MDVNSFTHRAAEALATAQREARSSDHQRIEPEHLLVALLADPDGVVYPVVRRAGADPGMLRTRAAEALDRIPKVYGPEQETVASPSWAGSSSGPARRPPPSATSTSPPSTCCWPSPRARPPRPGC